MIYSSLLSVFCVAVHLLASTTIALPNPNSPPPFPLAARSSTSPVPPPPDNDNIGLPIYFIQSMDKHQLTQLSKDLIAAYLADLPSLVAIKAVGSRLSRVLDSIYLARVELSNEIPGYVAKMSLEPATAQKIFDSLVDCRNVVNLLQGELALKRFFVGLNKIRYPKGLKPDGLGRYF